jgi:2-oxoglutarate dehydrogenase E1 component
VIASFAQRAKEGTLASAPVQASCRQKQVRVLQLINAYRFLGNRWAQLDPLKRQERPSIAELEPSYYGFTEADLSTSFTPARSRPSGGARRPCARFSKPVRQTYCGSVGTEYMYLTDVVQKRWLQSQAGADPLDAGPRPEDKKRFLSA